MATNPVHAGRFALTCADCHGVSAWRPAQLEHGWPLTGKHAEQTCGGCHPGDPAVYEDTPTTCSGCHAEDRERVTEPDHVGFSMDCADCHTADGWRPAELDHGWPLEGAHATALCASCHGGEPPVYAGTPSACVDCHRSDYDSSSYPGHAEFPITCQDCHTADAWTPASGSHPEPSFPITSGPHKVVDCMGCHNAELGGNGADNADCVGCHTGRHTRASTDDKHDEIADYPGSAAPPNFCLDCHPDGRH